VPPFFKRKLILTYVFALSVRALLSLASHFTLDKILREQKGSAAVINVAGRQRMLSQRIASLVAQSPLGDDVARTDLLVSIDELENAHHNLLRGDRELHLPPAASDPALQLIYFGGLHPLDAEVENYVGRARRIALTAPTKVAVSRDTTVLFRSCACPASQKFERSRQRPRTRELTTTCVLRQGPNGNACRRPRHVAV
jgi:hypothetical protein